MLFETHAHTCDAQFDADRAEVMARARSQGVEALVEIADGPDGWNKARALAEQQRPDWPDLRWTCGFHPHYAAQAGGFDFAKMKEAAASPLCAAIGEIGLDYCKSEATKEQQMALFRGALDVAAALDKPVVIHCRDAQADMLRVLKSFFGGLGRRDLCLGVIHCFAGDQAFAEGCMDLGFMLGVDGPVTYPSAKGLREVLAQVPLDKLVLETDCPYLPPQGYRGQRNEPSYLKLVAEKLAEVKSVPVETLLQATNANARRLYRWKS